MTPSLRHGHFGSRKLYLGRILHISGGSYFSSGEMRDRAFYVTAEHMVSRTNAGGGGKITRRAPAQGHVGRFLQHPCCAVASTRWARAAGGPGHLLQGGPSLSPPCPRPAPSPARHGPSQVPAASECDGAGRAGRGARRPQTVWLIYLRHGETTLRRTGLPGRLRAGLRCEERARDIRAGRESLAPRPRQGWYTEGGKRECGGGKELCHESLFCSICDEAPGTPRPGPPRPGPPPALFLAVRPMALHPPPLGLGRANYRV